MGLSDPRESQHWVKLRVIRSPGEVERMLQRSDQQRTQQTEKKNQRVKVFPVVGLSIGYVSQVRRPKQVEVII